MTGRIARCTALVLAIFFLVPFLTYGTLAFVAGLEPPAGVSPGVMMTSVFIEKLGHAIVFVGLYYWARKEVGDRWLYYAGAWWLMFLLGEIGVAMHPGYSWLEAVAGMLAETIYFPLAAWVAHRMLGPGEE